MQNKWLPIFVVFVALFAGGFYAFKTNLLGLAAGMPGSSSDGNGVVCTMEAKLCPDGVTYVGRTGPHCEFSACPTATTTPTTTDNGGAASSHAIVVLDAHLNQTVSALGASIKPLEVIEDSRCPAGVYCIQAGRVVVKAQVTTPAGTTIQNFILNTPLVVDNQKMILVSVAPGKFEATTIVPSDYVFTFNVYAHQN